MDIDILGVGESKWIDAGYIKEQTGKLYKLSLEADNNEKHNHKVKIF